MKSVYPISLGCPKNLVDSEKMVGQLAEAGFAVAASPEGADIILVNTCSFLEEAEQESYEIIDQALALRDEGSAGAVVVAGCLPQKYLKKPPPGLRKADGLIGVADRTRVVELLRKISERKKGVRRRCATCLKSAPSPLIRDTARFRLTPSHYAYIKIAEGCSHGCAYCVIPRIRGPYRSKPIEIILEEARELAAAGTREIMFIAEDTTLYGKDLYGEQRLPELLARTAEIEGIAWIRLLYTHPAHITDALIDEIASNPKICKYIDVPIQHASDKILRLMGRKVSPKRIESTVTRLRERVQNIFIRTAVIVGFPGETRKDFQKLLEFLAQAKFERLGAFTYSRQKGTRANNLRDHVPEDEKQARWEEVMELQQGIAFEHNRRLVGNELDVIVDHELETGEEADITGDLAESERSRGWPCWSGHRPRTDAPILSAAPSPRPWMAPTLMSGSGSTAQLSSPKSELAEVRSTMDGKGGGFEPPHGEAETHQSPQPGRHGVAEIVSFTHRGRTYGDAPEVDGSIFLSGEKLAPGYIAKAFVVATRGYDLLGVCDAFPIRKSRPPERNEISR